MGVVYILISGVAFGLLPWFARVAFDHGAEPLGLLTVRFSIAMLCLVAFHLLIRKNVAWPSRRLFVKLLILGAIGYAPQSTLFFFSVERIDISLATIVFYTYPILVVILSWAFLRQPPTTAVTLSLAVAVTGAALTAGQIRTGSWTGVVLMLAAALWYAVYIVIVSRIAKNTDAFMALTVIMIGAALAHGVSWLFHRDHFPSDATGWTAALAAAIISTILSLGLLIAGVQRVGPSQASVLSTIEPVVSITVGVIALNENLTIVRVIGAILVVIGVAMMAHLSRA